MFKIEGYQEIWGYPYEPHLQKKETRILIDHVNRLMKLYGFHSILSFCAPDFNSLKIKTLSIKSSGNASRPTFPYFHLHRNDENQLFRLASYYYFTMKNEDPSCDRTALCAFLSQSNAWELQEKEAAFEETSFQHIFKSFSWFDADHFPKQLSDNGNVYLEKRGWKVIEISQAKPGDLCLYFYTRDNQKAEIRHIAKIVQILPNDTFIVESKFERSRYLCHHQLDAICDLFGDRVLFMNKEADFNLID